MRHKLVCTALVTLTLVLGACSGSNLSTQPVSSDVRAVVNAEGEVVGYQAFRLDTRRWYEARAGEGTGYALTERGARKYRNDRWRQTRGN